MMVYQKWLKWCVQYIGRYPEKNHIDFQIYYGWKQHKYDIWKKKRQLLSHQVDKKS